MPAAGEAQNRLTLRYTDAELEAEFQTKFRARALRQLQAAIGSSIALWLGLSLLLYVFVKPGPRILAASIGMSAYLGVSLVVARWARTAREVQYVVAASNTVAGLVALLIIWDAGLFSSFGPLVVILVVLFGFTLANLPFVVAVTAAAPYVGGFVFLALRSPDFEHAGVQSIFVLTMTGILAVSSYMFESATRRDFLLRRVIADQERELEVEKARQLGQYTLGGRLGEGGMGVVHRATHALLRRPTAIKLLGPRTSEPHHLEDFEREVQLTSELSHPNIVAVYDYGHTPEGEFYYAMELLPGVDLETLVERDGPMSVARALRVLKQVCSALEEAHHRGLIHRDIKPGNIILSKIGTQLDVAKVVDFGLVRDMQEVMAPESKGAVSGTPAYIAPEALTSPELVGPASDLYAVGAVGFFLLTGRQVFEAVSRVEVYHHHVHTPAPVASAKAPNKIPTHLDAILQRCLAKAPGDRFASAAELGAALAAIEPPTPWTDADAEAWWARFDDKRALDEKLAQERGRAVTVDLRRR